MEILWQRNLKTGCVKAWEWMGVRGLVVEVVISLIAALLYGRSALLSIAIFVGVLFALYGLVSLWFGLVVVPYRAQKTLEELNNRTPKRLRLFVGPSPMKGWIVRDDKDIHMAYLKVISRETKKIVELHATRVLLLQRTADMKSDIRGAEFGHGPTNFRFEWESGGTFAQLIPGATDELLIAELDPDVGYPVFGEPKATPSNSKVPAIYEFHIRFKGRLDGETEFAYYDYFDGELYCHPENGVLDFAADAPDIPDNLRPKVFFANKKEQQ